MINGIGADIMNVNRLKGLGEDLEDPFFIKTFTPSERIEAESRANPLVYYAERFSAKEAVFKSLQISSNDVRLNEIETLNDNMGRPYVNLYGRASEIFSKMGGRRISISLSNDGDMVLAFAVCEI